jgi:hypothetical protein
MCGVFGSCLTITAIVVVASTIFFKGYKCPHIPPLCRVAVYFLGLSGVLQYVSIFNLFFQMEDLVLRSTTQISYAVAKPDDVRAQHILTLSHRPHRAPRAAAKCVRSASPHANVWHAGANLDARVDCVDRRAR